MKADNVNSWLSLFSSIYTKAWYQENGRNELPGVRDKIDSVDADWVVSFFDRVLGRVDENTGQSLSRDVSAE